MQALADAAADPATASYGPIRAKPCCARPTRTKSAAIYGGASAPDACAIVTGCNQAFVRRRSQSPQRVTRSSCPHHPYFNHKMALDMLGIRAVALALHAG